MEMTQYPNGSFCWSELMTLDSDAAKKFYAAILGWTYHDDKMSETQIYTMALVGDKNAAAMYAMNEEQRKMKHPCAWTQYISVDDVEATVGRVKEHGGEVVMEPMDVMDIGRMALVRDNVGAVLALWQPKKVIGAQVMNEPGAFCWNELYTPNVDTSGAFYTNVFGWTAETTRTNKHEYTVFKDGDRYVAGMMEIQKEWGEIPPHWVVYFTVADCDQTVKKAREMGATVNVEPTDIEPGRFAMLMDPQGAAFGVIKMKPMEGGA